MKVGIIGSGGREHSLCEALSKSKKISKIYCFPGNAGTQKIAKNIDINVDDFEILKNFVVSEKIELIVVGPEKPLVEGIVDFFFSSLARDPEKLLQVAFSLIIFSTVDRGKQV